MEEITNDLQQIENKLWAKIKQLHCVRQKRDEKKKEKQLDWGNGQQHTHMHTH